ncbi:MAG TPA: terminase family protein [Acidimicrobiales bacterium]|nr:terminase family protein [Acidimicrobiales bacterium]
MSVDLDADQYSLEQLWQESEFRAIAALTSTVPNEHLVGFLKFCEEYVHIRHPEFGRIKFEPFEAQVEAVTSWLSCRYSLVLKARQIGFSTLVAIFALWNAAFHPDRPILMLSRTEREAIKLLQKSKYAFQFLPEWMKFRIGPINMTQTRIEFTNGSYIESLPSASDPARGESAFLIIVDELAFLPNSEEAWSAIEPVADVGGRVIMLSTANGEGNLFHKLWVESQAGNNRFESLFFPWSANNRDKDWYEAKAADLPEWQMAQEYPDNAEDAFLKSGRPVFDLRMLREIETREPIAKGWFKADGEFDDMGGDVWIWEWPEENERYVVGVDVAQGLEHGDYSSVHVIACRSRKMVATYHARIDPDLLGTEVLPRLGRFYRQALIGVESNQHGLTTLKYLHGKKYFPIYYERSPKYKKSVPTDVLGFRTTQVSKPLIIDELAEALRNDLEMPDALTLAELKTFVRTSKNKMEGSPYDDRTMSLAIANTMRKFVFFAEFTPDDNPPPGSFGDWEKRVYGESFKELLEMGEKRRPALARKPIGIYAVRGRTPF